MKQFSFLNRKKDLAKLKSQTFDLIVVGGGITGAGVARDAASRGMSVALVEQGDFSSGTSSRSSKLIHGGIRYLENMEFGLVFEALNERRILFEIAPHLVHPLRFMLPVYKDSRVGMFKLSLGMWLYDLLALFETPEIHQRLNRKQTHQRAHFMNDAGLVGSFLYSDAYMDDDRLVHETLRAAHSLEAENAIVQVPYMRAQEPVWGKEDATLVGLTVEDLTSQEKFVIKGKHVVSSVGPWSDQVAKSFYSEWTPLLRPSKGIHITLPRDRLPLKDAIVMAVDKEERIVFAIPRHEMIIVGTTDTDFKERPEDVKVETKDVEYLLQVCREYFPGANLKESDIIGAYAGVRPLVQDGSKTEGKTSREHTVLSLPGGFTLVAGGKYTTYRSMAQSVVEAALKQFPQEDQVKYARANTKGPLNPLVTAESYQESFALVEALSEKFKISRAEARLLLERHGLEAVALLNEAVLSGYQKPQEFEAFHAVHYTYCFNLVDYYWRRFPLFLSEKDHGLKHLDDVVRVFATELHWEKSQIEHQVKMLHQHIAQEMAWNSH